MYNHIAAGISPSQSTLYDPTRETENCGVGLVAQLKQIPSRRVVTDSDEMLIRMSHRGGCGCDPNSGDGAGMLVGMPDSFMRAQSQSTFSSDLPEIGKYTVGNLFFPRDDEAIAFCKKTMANLITQHSLKLVGWREVPTNNSMLGQDPLDSEPLTLQVFITNPGAFSNRDFERVLMKIRKVCVFFGICHRSYSYFTQTHSKLTQNSFKSFFAARGGRLQRAP